MKTVLVVDDNDRVRQMISEKLEKAGFYVRQASDGEEAIGLVRDADVILADLIMPKMSGLEFFKRVRGMGERERMIPIILMSAADKSVVIKQLQGLEHLVVNFMPKPIKTDDVVALVKKNATLKEDMAYLDSFKDKMDEVSKVQSAVSEKIKEINKKGFQPFRIGSLDNIKGESSDDSIPEAM